ncbi:hypothetical protein M5K25_003550 [Dendrobium thyrsiflorum]|uniref:Protein kinase domain-containing protein n=1 Tax=Dendrobium thyrsiflorum TaxID=117978 RepID=A0ABD0VJ85_DENTH
MEPLKVAHAIEEHNLQRERNLEGYQAPDVYHVTDNNLSSAHDNPPETQIREGGDIGSTSLNGSPFTLQHAPAPSQRKIPFNPQNVQPDSRGIHPPIASPSSAKGLNSLPMSSMAATPTETSSHLSPKNYSHFKGSSSHIPLPQNEANTAHAPSNSPPHPPERRKIHRPKPAPAISPTEQKSDRIEGSTVSSPFFLHPPSSQPSALLNAPAQNSKKRENYGPHPNKGKRYAPQPYDADHVISAPLNSPIEISKNKRRHLVPPANFNGFDINPSAPHAPMMTPKHKRSYAPSPYIGGAMINLAPSPSPVEISNNKTRNYASPPYVEGPKISSAPLHPPIKTSKRNRRHHAPSTSPQDPHPPPIQTPTSSNSEISAAPLPSSASPTSYITWQIHPPEPSPSATFGGKSSSTPPQPKRTLPPPPPNSDCGPVVCQSPLTNPCPGSPCTCVLPIKVGLRLGVALYIFFPLVSEFAKEIATGVSMKQSHVRIMGANSAIEDPEKTDVLIDLVPLGKSFDNTTVFMTFEKFWKKQVSIQASYFGDYVVLYVSYPGLPPSPPTSAYLNGEAYASNNNGRAIHPLAVDLRSKKKNMGASVIAIIAMTSLIALVLIIGAAWLLLLRNRDLTGLLPQNFQSSQLPIAKSSGVPMNVGIGPSSTSASLSSSMSTYNGSAKTFTLADMERTTNRFDDSRVIGEGGFGRVYQGTLEDGRMVAVKVLKRVDRQGEREFLAEVEMLSRLHHRNLVKLIGICTEENVRCLVYELIPNGCVESHLHGVDKETAPLDWNARVKIALGAARGLAYLHEDSSPCVIHRDFKSSNILLEHDFTPRVSDFGLARSTLDEGKEHISTRVMGTFGYVDPEYAMTGHLLVKSDVYSYGVVLLELLTGRKPIDMSQPPGQENLVAWTRSLLTNIEGLQTIIDPVLSANYSQNSVAKVLAIASMCVQPEVSHRPLMSEVVQALKLVYNESDEYGQSVSYSQDDMSVRDVETARERHELDVFCRSSSFAGDASGSFRRYSSSGPLRTGRSRLFWQRGGRLGSGSSSEHGFVRGFWLRRHRWS